MQIFIISSQKSCNASKATVKVNSGVQAYDMGTSDQGTLTTAILYDIIQT